jgi:predicted HNH restriction endonuclease
MLIPGDIVEEFLDFLRVGGSSVPRFAEASDIEGTKTEVVRLTSKRSRRLRDLAFKAAAGICSVCGRDFSKVLGGRGVRVLQVHHPDQVSSRVLPSITKVDDLIVVCANCHLLLHLDSGKSLTVGQLQEMLRAVGASSPF